MYLEPTLLPDRKPANIPTAHKAPHNMPAVTGDQDPWDTEDSEVLARMPPNKYGWAMVLMHTCNAKRGKHGEGGRGRKDLKLHEIS